MTIGDIFGILAATVLLALGAWALMTCSVVLFPSRCSRAKDSIESRPLGTILLGFLCFFVVIFFGGVLLASPFPLVKLLGLVVYALGSGVVALGSGGAANLVSERMRRLQSGMEPLESHNKAALAIILACTTPLVGTLLLTPLFLALSMGAGVRSLLPVRQTVAARP